MRLLFVSPADLSSPRGGRAMLASLHRDALYCLLGDAFGEHRLHPETPTSAWQRINGHIDGATAAGAAATIAALDAHDADAVWFDGANLGRLVKAVRTARPRVRLLTFCHNVEARFFLGGLRHCPGVRAAGVLIGNAVAERLALRSSDDVIALSDRDSGGLARYYGRAADHILPMAIADQLGTHSSYTPIVASPYLLFVGGGFYANIAGIRWFAAEVAPQIDMAVKVVGRDMDVLADEFARTANVELVGAVDDLAPWYAGAALVIAPIFDGSGMKTKVAEALMHGKHVAGTPEAFSGYADDVVAANRLCADADAFVRAASEISAAPPPSHDPAMRVLYERDHSPAAAAARLASTLGIVTPAA